MNRTQIGIKIFLLLLLPLLTSSTNNTCQCPSDRVCVTGHLDTFQCACSSGHSGPDCTGNCQGLSCLVCLDDLNGCSWCGSTETCTFSDDKSCPQLFYQASDCPPATNGNVFFIGTALSVLLLGVVGSSAVYSRCWRQGKTGTHHQEPSSSSTCIGLWRRRKLHKEKSEQTTFCGVQVGLFEADDDLVTVAYSEMPLALAASAFITSSGLCAIIVALSIPNVDWETADRIWPCAFGYLVGAFATSISLVVLAKSQTCILTSDSISFSTRAGFGICKKKAQCAFDDFESFRFSQHCICGQLTLMAMRFVGGDVFVMGCGSPTWVEWEAECILRWASLPVPAGDSML